MVSSTRFGGIACPNHIAGTIEEFKRLRCLVQTLHSNKVVGWAHTTMHLLVPEVLIWLKNHIKRLDVEVGEQHQQLEQCTEHDHPMKTWQRRVAWLQRSFSFNILCRSYETHHAREAADVLLISMKWIHACRWHQRHIYLLRLVSSVMCLAMDSM